MLAIRESRIETAMSRPKKLTRIQFATLATILVVLGGSTIWSSLSSLWTMWTTDPLKSIGIVIPVVSLVLILRAWHSLKWNAEGTWWGLVLLIFVAAVAWAEGRAILLLVMSPHWSTPIPPNSLVLMAYGASAVLFLGGTRLFRTALFPIVLLWFANPVPHVFTSLVDLPLQHVSAHVARSFAMQLGNSLTPDNLRLMFTPDFGMFIAPGCDGIRGSVTMGFIALIAGYVYRFRWYANAVVVLGAVALGYVFNLVRLCTLVLYYVVALHVTWLQNKAERADYLIGAGLFLVATLLLLGTIGRLRTASQSVDSSDTPFGEADESQEPSGSRSYAQLAVMGAIALLGCVVLTREVAVARPSNSVVADDVMGRFPERVGDYRRVRTWEESVLGGAVIYVWGQYAPVGGGVPIALGISPVPDWHDPAICHSVRAETPLWQGELRMQTADVGAVNFSSGYYDDGVTRYVEASTICSSGTCGEFRTERTRFGFIYSRPDPSSLLANDPKRPVRFLLRAESMDTTGGRDVVREQLTGDLRNFLSDVRLGFLSGATGH